MVEVLEMFIKQKDELTQKDRVHVEIRLCRF
jgi:hypothetical protein